MMISETKLDNTFPNGQILIDGFNEPIRLDRIKNETDKWDKWNKSLQKEIAFMLFL